MTAFAHIDGNTAVSLHVHVPGVGPWWVDAIMQGAPDLSGEVTIGVGELELAGTVDPSHNGTHGLQRALRVVAGGGGWAKLLPARHYHNDARLRARTIAEDAAREAGETLGATFAPAEERIGVAYVRQAGPASRALEDVIGGVPWWVAYDGTTHVGQRATSTAAAGSYEVLEHRPDEHVVVLALDDPRAVAIGSILAARLDAPQTVRELELVVEPESMVALAWCGGVDGARGRIAGLLRGIAQRAAGEKLFGHWRYRVVRMRGDRVELQAMSAAAGLPNVLPISMAPGVAGAHAELTPGAHVLVVFVEGDRRMPLVTHFAGKDGVGWAPVSLVLDATGASSSMKLGANATKKLAYADDVAQAFQAVQTTIDAFVPGTGGAEFPTPFVAPSAASIGTNKTVAE